MRQNQLMRIASRPIDDEEAIGFVSARSRTTPAAACAVNQVIVHKAVLECVALRLLQSLITRRWNRFTAIRKAGDWHTHERDGTFRDFRVPHAVTTRFRSNQHVQMLILTL